MKFVTLSLILIFASALHGNKACCQTGTTSADGPEQAPVNYVTSWYAGSGEQMELALHPELVKYRVSSSTEVSSVSFSWMIDAAQKCYGCIPEVHEGRLEITILDETDSTAAAKVLSNNFYDYLHLVKCDGYWKVFNVVWDYYDRVAGDSAKLTATVENFLEYWQQQDKEQMAGLLHPGYSVGTAVFPCGADRLNKTEFIASLSDAVPDAGSNKFTFEILDMYLNTASVKVRLGPVTEYLHLSCQDASWYLVNALRFE